MSEVSLRVLYTVNTSPQYILAKAPHKIPFISADSSSPSGSRVKHGCASLKACAIAICRSSPELRPDATKDFSLYILDPLEDLISNCNGQSGGVAVGLGLLSATLSPYTPDTTMVTGTFVDSGQGENALEVVMSLRQVIPPVLHTADGYSQDNVAPKRTKTNPKRAKSNQPYFTSNPLPLPSFNDRLFACYAQQRTPEVQKAPKEARKPDPAHLTRAHQLPTPYIGPPKRKYSRDPDRYKGKESNSSCEATDDPPDLPSSQVSEETNDGVSTESVSSDQLSTSDTESIASSSTIRPSLADKPPDLSEAAVMLAALSSVSSKSNGKEALLAEQENVPPNPELVSFLRAYLAYLEAQQPGPSDGTSSHSSSQETASRAVISNTNTEPPDPSEDKENQKPQPLTESSKGMEAKSSEHVSLLGSGRNNARQLENGRLEEPDSEHPKNTFPLLDCSRKRKLSNASLPEQDQIRRRASSVSQVKLPDDDLSGIRLNRGWGGLRVRSDGTLWGEQPPVATSQRSSSASYARQNGNSTFFRSSGQGASAASIRKGPYVVPDWAKGVPPPAPPARQESIKEDCAKMKKRGKSKSLNRLGGRATIKRTMSMNLEVGCASGQPVSFASSSQNTSTAQQGSSTSPNKSPRRPPIFAYSSPVGKSKLGSLFQAFQTSPCRPVSVRKFSSVTPLRRTKTSPSGSANRLSLFTPSPSNAKMGSCLKPDDPFAEDDGPPSPTPTKRSPMSRKTPALNRRTTASTTLCHEEGITSPSSLPIASSDDAQDSGNSSRSSDSTVMNSSKVHDWSSWDLPPSSPPPPSSPTITPMEGSDLPCSDIPSPDLLEADSPAVASGTSDSNPSSPAKARSQLHFSALIDDSLFGPSGISIGEREDGPSLGDAFLPPLDIAEEEGPSATAAFEALQNGLGQEDLSEGWNLLNSLFEQIPGDAHSNTAATFFGSLEDQSPSWTQDAYESFSGADFNSISNFGVETDPMPIFESDDQDPASIVAANFKDLLEGCLV